MDLNNQEYLVVYLVMGGLAYIGVVCNIHDYAIGVLLAIGYFFYKNSYRHQTINGSEIALFCLVLCIGLPTLYFIAQDAGVGLFEVPNIRLSRATMALPLLVPFSCTVLALIGYRRLAR